MSEYRIFEHTPITMRDGVVLSARIWIPQAEPVPVVLEYIPYRKEDLYRGADDFWGDALASRGIAFARVDVRGTGESEGILTDEYAEQEIADGLEIIEWLADQSWSNGCVGMRGISWGAINTLYIAAREPEALKAIMPIAGTDNRLTDDAHFIGGNVAHTGLQWGTLFKLVMAGPPDPGLSGDGWLTKWRDRLNASQALLATWLEREAEEWRPLDVSKIRIPTYFVAGWDDTYSAPTWRMWRKSQAPRKAMFGPWGHTYPYFGQPSGLNWVDEEVAWWQRWLRQEREAGVQEEEDDEENDREEDQEYRIFIPHETLRQGNGQRREGHWLIGRGNLASRTHSWHLDDSGLTSKPGEMQAVTVEADHIVGQCKPEWLDRPPLEQSHDDALSVVFDTAPFAGELICAGEARLIVEIESPVTELSLAVRLCVVTTDGQSWLLNDKVENLTGTVEPGQRGEVTIELGAMAHRIGPGEILRVAISQSLWPLVWPLPDTGVVTITAGRLDVEVALEEPSELDLETVHRPTSLQEYEIVPHDADGRLILASTPVPTTVTSGRPGAEVQITRSREEVSEIVQTRPDSAVWSQTSRQTWSRADWQCDLEAGYRLTCDDEYFHITEWLRAEHRGERIYAQEESAKIHRRGR